MKLGISSSISIVFATACGASSPAPAPIIGAPQDPSAKPETPPSAPAITSGTCELDETQALESIRTTDGTAHPWRFIGADKKPLATPYMFDNGPDYFQEGFARIVDARGKIGFISKTGAIVVPPKYDFAYPYCHGLAKTALDGKAGYLDTNGKPATGPAGDDRPLILPSSGG